MATNRLSIGWGASVVENNMKQTELNRNLICLFHGSSTHWNKWLKCHTLLTTQSNTVMRNLHDCAQCAQTHEQLVSEGGTRPWRWFRDIVPDVLHAIRHAPISSPVLHPAARHYISSFLLSATQEMNPGNNHSTCAQMTPKHKTDRHSDFNIDSPFPLLLLHSPLPLLFPSPPSPPPSLEMCSNSKSDCHISFCRSKKKKKEGRKAMKMMISLSSSRGLSYAIYFDIPPHQLHYLTILCTEDIKSLQTGENMVAGAYSKTEC